MTPPTRCDLEHVPFNESTQKSLPIGGVMTPPYEQYGTLYNISCPLNNTYRSAAQSGIASKCMVLP